MYPLRMKRIYEAPEAQDGYRMLVDRLWPRGLKKETAQLDEWNKEIAPSTELRKWFGHKAENFSRFSTLYKSELKTKAAELKRIKYMLNTQPLTLLYASANREINHVKVLLSVLRHLR